MKFITLLAVLGFVCGCAGGEQQTSSAQPVTSELSTAQDSADEAKTAPSADSDKKKKKVEPLMTYGELREIPHKHAHLDADGDGILNANDGAPYEPEDEDGDEDEDGIPE